MQTAMVSERFLAESLLLSELPHAFTQRQILDRKPRMVGFKGPVPSLKTRELRSGYPDTPMFRLSAS
jgi:hypothetical protein